MEDINELLEVGQEVEVVAMKLDWEKDRLSFSLKQALPDPWDRCCQETFPKARTTVGIVVRLTDFGAFVTLAAGVDGLLHISKLGAGKRINHPREVVTKGQDCGGKDRQVLTRIISVFPCHWPGPKREEAQEESEEDLSQFLKGKSDSMGTLADLLKSKLAGKKK